MSTELQLSPEGSTPATAPSPPMPEPVDTARTRALGADRLRRILRPFWRDRRLGAAVVVGLGAAWGMAVAVWTPRGPVTTSQAMWSIVVSIFVGLIGGLVLRSRWAMLALPVSFAVACELGRLGTDGPTVDGPVFSTYGIMALVVGRGFHALISLLPIMWAAAIGAGTARAVAIAGDERPVDDPEARVPRRWYLGRRGVTIFAGVGLLAFSLVLVRPASTAPIVDADGRTLPGSVAELTTVEVNGHDLSLMIRGHSIDNPVLLFLAGGPGGSELGAMRNHLPELERHFTVATWDQRGTGKSYGELDPTSTISLDGFVADTLAVTDHLRDRFGQERIYLLGQSWGSTLGVLAVQQAPERYVAFIGTGQMVSQVATDRIFYDDTLEWAQAQGDSGLVADLTAIGPPPYESVLDYETALTYEHEIYPYDHSANSEGEGGFSENFFVDEYTLTEKVHLLGAFMDTFTALYPQLQEIDFRTTATELDIPVFFVQGAHEADGRAEPFAEWYPLLSAPHKDLTVLDTSGHRPLFEQPDEFVAYMVDTVLGTTVPT